jgi:PAS domain S-box-containing protein
MLLPKESSVMSAIPAEDRDLLVVSMQLFGAESECIRSCNKDTKTLLGFTKKDLVGQKMCKLMPRAFRELHHHFIEHFLGQKDDQIGYRHPDVPVLNVNGYFLYVSLFTRILSSDQALLMLGFMKPLKGHYMVLDLAGRTIAALGERFADILGVREVVEDKLAVLDLRQVFPELPFDRRCMERLHSQKTSTMINLRHMAKELKEIGLSNSVPEGLTEVMLEVLGDVEYNGRRLVYLKLQHLTQKSPQIRPISTNLNEHFRLIENQVDLE